MVVQLTQHVLQYDPVNLSSPSDRTRSLLCLHTISPLMTTSLQVATCVSRDPQLEKDRKRIVNRMVRTFRIGSPSFSSPWSLCRSSIPFPSMEHQGVPDRHSWGGGEEPNRVASHGIAGPTSPQLLTQASSSQVRALQLGLQAICSQAQAAFFGSRKLPQKCTGQAMNPCSRTIVAEL